MVSEGLTLLWLVAVLLLIWLGVISYFLFRTIANYNRLTQGVSTKTLSEVLSQLLDEHRVTKEELTKVLKEIALVRKESHVFIQKMGMVRFNPFADTGGDQSFALALLDGEDNGMIITSLYARTGTRWYVKMLKKGKGVEHELSAEEKQALKNAFSHS